MNRRHALALLSMMFSPAQAQPAPDLAAELGRIGRVIAVAPTAALYAPRHGVEPFAGVTITRDAAYGPDVRHRLDVFAPEAAGAGRPVLVFVPGGGFTGGDKRMAGQPAFYDNIGAWAARAGFVGVTMNYRLAPAHAYPTAQEDIGAALGWVATSIRAHGGDPARVVLMGHSAGAVHAAIYAADQRLRPAGAPPPSAYVLVSGLYDFGAEDVPPNDRAYMGEAAETRAVRSPRAGLMAVREPILVAYGTLNPPRFVVQSETLANALLEAGRPPAVVVLEGHSHISEILAIGTDDTALTDPLAAFIRR